MSDQKDFTLKEVADHFRVNRKTILQKITSGALQAYRIGREYRITQEAIDRYKQENQIRANDEELVEV